MTNVGTLGELWRYPVKSMAGERLTEAFAGFSGIYGDRCAAFKNSAARKGTPYLTGSRQEEMVLYRPRFRYPDRAALPPNLLEAMNIEPGITHANAEADDLTIDVLTPSGSVVPLDDPALLEMLGRGLGKEARLTLVRSDRALTDCRPVSLISLQTARQVQAEAGVREDQRRFRSNIYADLASSTGFSEDEWVGRRLWIGPRVVLAILERDPRCKMMSLDPETGEHRPEVLRYVAREHSACAGVYCAVIVEGIVHQGDALTLMD